MFGDTFQSLKAFSRKYSQPTSPNKPVPVIKQPPRSMPVTDSRMSRMNRQVDYSNMKDPGNISTNLDDTVYQSQFGAKFKRESSQRGYRNRNHSISSKNQDTVSKMERPLPGAEKKEISDFKKNSELLNALNSPIRESDINRDKSLGTQPTVKQAIYQSVQPQFPSNRMESGTH